MFDRRGRERRKSWGFLLARFSLMGLVRLGFRPLVEAVLVRESQSGPLPGGTGRTHGGIKAREVRTEGERFVPFGEAFREALPSERLSLPLGQV